MTDSTPPVTGWTDPTPTGWLSVRVDFMSPRDCLRVAWALARFASGVEDRYDGAFPVVEAFCRQLSDSVAEYGRDLLSAQDQESWRLLLALNDDDALAAWLTPESPGGEVE